mmetsp:Transcript_10190/g.23503  ORF Transcript_10190/g.23503 Transcript_10190/m.23503 type:complete len:147 (+) Transcript_10190:58-498(+)
MALNFKKYAQTGEAFINKLANELGDSENTARAGRILRVVLHVFRNQSSPQESMQLISQLPMFIKALYVDGWRIGQKQKRIRNVEDFLFEVREANQPNGRFDFGDEEDILKAVKTVFRLLKEYVSEGEMEDLIKTLPEKLRPLLEEA